MAEKIKTLVCELCGEDASGPDAKDVASAMARHKEKKHKEPVKHRKPAKKAAKR